MSYRTMDVFYDYERMTDKEAVEIFKNIEHVVDAYTTVQSGTIIEFSSIGETQITGQFTLLGADERVFESFNFIKGNNISNNRLNEIICPLNFYTQNDLREKNTLYIKDHLMDTRNYINQIIHFSYHSNKTDFNSKPIEYHDELTMVGIFQNNPLYLDEDICYTSHQTIEKIVTRERENTDPSISTAILRVDNSKNNEYVKNELKKLNMNGLERYEINTTLIDTFPFLIILIIIIIFIITFIIIYIFNKKSLKDKIQEMNLYKSVGFEWKDILKLHIVENIFLLTTSLISSAIITSIIGMVLKILIADYTILIAKIPIKIDFISLLYAWILLWIIEMTMTLLNKEDLIESNIIENLGE